MKRFLFFLLTAALLAGCDVKQQTLSDLERFTERIGQKSDGWAEVDWDDALQKFSEIDGSLNRYQYPDSTERHITNLRARCVLKFAEHYYGN